MGRQRRGGRDWSAHEGALSTFLLMAHLSNDILGRGERVWGSTGKQDVFGRTRGCESSVASRGTLSSAQPWELGELFSSLHPLSCIYFICSGISALMGCSISKPAWLQEGSGNNLLLCYSKQRVVFRERQSRWDKYVTVAFGKYKNT